MNRIRLAAAAVNQTPMAWATNARHIRAALDAARDAGVDMAGTLHVALASGDNVRTKAFPIASHPAITKTRSAKQALNMVRLALLNRV